MKDAGNQMPEEPINDKDASQSNKRKKKLFLAVSLAIGAVLMLLVTVIAILIFNLSSQERVITVADNIGIWRTGIEGQVSLAVYIEDAESVDKFMRDTDERKIYLEGLTYSYKGEKIPVAYPDEPLFVDVKTGDVLKIVIEDPNSLGEKFGLTLDTFELETEVSELDRKIEQVANIPSDEIRFHRFRIMQELLNDDPITEYILQGEHVMTFYKQEDTYNPKHPFLSIVDSRNTSALTIFYGFQYGDSIYFAGETNIVQHSYDDGIVGVPMFDSALQLSDEERQPGSIITAMEQRGYSLLP